MPENSPKNLGEALKLIAQLQAENTQLHEENKKLELVANNLSGMLAKSRRMMFGRSSEHIKNMYGHEQLSFFNEAERAVKPFVIARKTFCFRTPHLRLWKVSYCIYPLTK